MNAGIYGNSFTERTDQRRRGSVGQENNEEEAQK